MVTRLISTALALGLFFAAGVALAEDGPQCACALDLSVRNPAYDCRGKNMPKTAMLCQKVGKQVFCGTTDDKTYFSGEVSCSEGFCLSLDGERCAVDCGCSNN